MFPSGDSDGVGVQRTENIQNGSAATEVALCVLSQHCGPNEKGMGPPGVSVMHCTHSFNRAPAYLLASLIKYAAFIYSVSFFSPFIGL